MQSTKLCIHEERVLELVLETMHMPQPLAHMCAKRTILCPVLSCCAVACHAEYQAVHP